MWRSAHRQSSGVVSDDEAKVQPSKSWLGIHSLAEIMICQGMRTLKTIVCALQNLVVEEIVYVLGIIPTVLCAARSLEAGSLNS